MNRATAHKALEFGLDCTMRVKMAAQRIAEQEPLIGKASEALVEHCSDNIRLIRIMSASIQSSNCPQAVIEWLEGLK